MAPRFWGKDVERGRVVLIVSLVVLSAFVALIGAAPTASAAVGPKTIAVDGNPSDWVGAAPSENTGWEDAGEFIWNDAANDDVGDGDYTYPKASDVNHTGMFDLLEVRITADATNLYVLLRLRDLFNPPSWGAADGFGPVSAVILIDTTRDAAGGTSARPNVNLASGAGWEYWAKVGNTGWHAENAKVFDAWGRWAPIANKGNDALEAIEVSIPLAFIGKDGTAVNGATWQFMVLLGGFDGGGPNGFRDVRAARWGEDWVFGGGADHGFDPQAIDIAFASSAAAQAAELGSYTASSPATLASSANVTFGALGFTPDTTAPTISGVSASASFNAAQISWTTDEVGSTMVLWGTAPNALTNPPVSRDEFVTSHGATLTNLQPLTTYYYRVLSRDIAENWAVSPPASFMTGAAPPSNLAAWVDTTFSWRDATGDDVGDGDYSYPQTNLVDWFGRADLKWLNFTRTATALHIHAELNANPEGEWRQRMGTLAIFIDQDHVVGSGARSVGLVGTGAELSDPHPMNVSVAPEFAWEYLVVANFQNRSAVGDPSGVGEMFVFNDTWNSAQRRWSLIYLSTAPSLSPEPDTGQIFAQGGNVVDIWLNYSVLGNTDNWTYAVAAMLYDDAARPFDTGGIRQVREAAGDWSGGGSNGPFNPNVYDLAFYPSAEAQVADLGQYRSGAYANITRAMKIDLTAMWYEPVVVQNLLDASASLSVAQVRTGESAGVTVYVTNRGVPVEGASVLLSANPASAVDLIGTNPATTNAFGAASFTARGRAVAADTTVSLTADATVGASSVSTSASLVVAALAHDYDVFAAAADGALDPGEQTTVTVTFLDKGAPVVGASVSLSSSSAVLAVSAPTGTTNAQGRVTFTVTALYTETRVDATLTATATNGTAQASATLTVTVKAYAHRYALSGTASVTIVGTNETTTLTFVFTDGGAPRAGATVSLTVPTGAPFDIVGNAQAATDANGRVSFSLRARLVSTDTPITVTATAANGTAQNAAQATVTLVAHAPAPAAVGPAGVATEVFGAVTVLLVIIAAAFGALWMRAKRGRPPEEPGAGGP